MSNDRSSSPAEEISEEVLFALKDIFPCDENLKDGCRDPLIENKNAMNLDEEEEFGTLENQIDKSIASLARILNTQLISPMKNSPIKLIENKSIGLFNTRNENEFHDMKYSETESINGDFESDDSMKDPNYFEESSDDSSESQQSENRTTVTKKFKKNNNVLKSQISPIPTLELERSEYNHACYLLPFTPYANQEAATPLNVQSTNFENTPPSRKRKIHKADWKCNVRSRNRQKGKAYVDIQGNVRPARSLRSVNCTSCVFLCDTIFNSNERQKIHNAFWNLDDRSKNFFYAKFIERYPVKRKSKKTPLKKRDFSYKFFFLLNDGLIQVCKQYFLRTLDISAKRIQWFYKHKYDEVTGIPDTPKKGKNSKKKIPEHKIQEVKEHIDSFPRVESHYCRANTMKEYLGSNLNIQKMYNLYKERCEGIPVKKHAYYKVFNEDFNLAFHMPKKDQCDLCCQLKNKTDLSELEEEKFRIHQENKLLTKNERDSDRKSKVETTAIITYDLENVFALPKAEVSSFYYKRKFAVYNLTGHCNLNKVTYCCIWTEAQSGRSGNDLASALFKILQSVVEDLPDVTKFILWSDSCVAQNKNRVNTTMLLNFLHRNPNISNIIHKYSEPGHSQLQEVDSVHSAIERHLRGVTLYSPVSLVQQLLKINYEKVHLRIIQMQDHHFFNFAEASNNLIMPPFCKVKVIKYNTQELCFLEYKTSISKNEPFTKIFLYKKVRNRSAAPIFAIKQLSSPWLLSEEKKRDLKSMLKYMTAVDVAYYNAIFSKNQIIKDEIVIEDKTRRSTRIIKKK